MPCTEAEWWLLDSGASVTVLSEIHVRVFGVELNHAGYSDDQTFSSANGSPVSMRQVNRITVAVLLEGPSGQKYEHAGVQVLVGNTRHNIWSTTMLCEKGWKFEQSQEGIYMRAPNGHVASEVTLFGNVPWIRLQPVPEKQSHRLTLAEASDEGSKISVLILKTWN